MEYQKILEWKKQISIGHRLAIIIGTRINQSVCVFKVYEITVNFHAKIGQGPDMLKLMFSP